MIDDALSEKYNSANLIDKISVLIVHYSERVDKNHTFENVDFNVQKLMTVFEDFSIEISVK